MLLGLSIVFQVYVIVTWFRLYGIVRKSIWLCAACGIFLITIYRVSEFFNSQSFQNVLAFLVSGFFAGAAALARRHLLEQRKVAEEVGEITHEPISPEPFSVATKLAEILTETKNKLDYYEAQAESNGLQKYEDSSCQSSSGSRAVD